MRSRSSQPAGGAVSAAALLAWWTSGTAMPRARTARTTPAKRAGGRRQARGRARAVARPGRPGGRGPRAGGGPPAGARRAGGRRGAGAVGVGLYPRHGPGAPTAAPPEEPHVVRDRVEVDLRAAG